jgi:2-phosphoglycerate kinase
VAERIENRLVDEGRTSITSNELQDVAVEVLQEVAGDRYAKNFVRWQDVTALDVPLVVLIGGATGVGKSTIATQLAARLGIVRVIPTDAVREVMRAMFSGEMMPTLYTSSFEAARALREPPGRPADPVIVGFREQTAAVAVGIRALIERAAVEGTSVIIEGAHVVPGFLDVGMFAERVVPVPLVVTVDDEELHRSHFAARSADSPSRPFERYLDNFESIRRVQRYIKSQALSHGWPIVPSYNLDQTIAAVIDLAVEKATKRAGDTRAADAAGVADTTVLELEGGVSR